MSIGFRIAFLRRIVLLPLLVFSTHSLIAEEPMSLAKAAQKTNNPVSDAWLLIVQNDYTVIEGDATGGSSKMQERLSFQPVLPVPIFDGEWNLVNRVVAQAFSAPRDEDINSDDPFGDRTNGLGDTIVFSLAAPNRDDGFIWGVGPTFILPTATEDVLGQEKWSAGPAALAVRLGNSSGGFNLESFNIGVLAQHWWDVEGDDDRADVNQSDIQYFINWKQDAVNLIGMTPNIQIDWEKSGSDRFSVPIGIGKIGFMRWGNTPVRWGIELQHYVMQPDPVGAEWNLKFFLAPVAANPFK
ncbi:hypothetical protein [Oceanicoccus sagamiensis]|uniref:Neuromedin U n=1 Tax=Oceanicoccus sagamiensis TaxID=716816 RepID=A0A1X9NCK4_9GAMM|nr:hypothetical protein [Oceanicoccus sagamiensis]ARN72697.1 hypothetical protein BST96_00345 [Oceanicoccus sagamiensis]